MQFDLSTLPTGTASANVSRATLALFVNKLGAAGDVNLSETNGSWTESGVTANGPVRGAAVATVGGGSRLDVTPPMDWLSGVTNNGFIIIPVRRGQCSVRQQREAPQPPRRARHFFANSGPAGAIWANRSPGANGAPGATEASRPLPTGIDECQCLAGTLLLSSQGSGCCRQSKWRKPTACVDELVHDGISAQSAVLHCPPGAGKTGVADPQAVSDRVPRLGAIGSNPLGRSVASFGNTGPEI